MTVHNKCRGVLQSLKRLNGIFPQSSLSNVYGALIETHIRYADVIWGSLLQQSPPLSHDFTPRPTEDLAIDNDSLMLSV